MSGKLPLTMGKVAKDSSILHSLVEDLSNIVERNELAYKVSGSLRKGLAAKAVVA